MNFKGKIYGDNRAEQIEKEHFYIICSFNFEKAETEFVKLGLVKGKNYEIADYYFEDLDLSSVNYNKKNIYIWGAGMYGKKCLEKIKNVKAFIDVNPDLHGSKTDGVDVISPEMLSQEEWEKSFIVVSPQLYYYDIRKKLLDKGLTENVDFVNSKKLFVSEFIKNTFYDENYYEFMCESMFRVFEVEATGDISNCCTTLIRNRSGNLLYEEYDEIWKSIFHKIQCLSLNNRTFSFCIPYTCPALINRDRQQITDELAKKLVYKEIPNSPEYLHLSIDETCNLYCESCRDCIKLSKGEELEKSMVMKEKIIRSPLKEVKEFYIAGNGEVFLSKIYEEIWKSEMANEADTIRVLTNGILLTPNRWEQFYEGKQNVNIWLYVSIDAASEETYESIRRGGKFDTLKKNMEFASQLRKEGKIQYFRINYVVQRKNYLEMEAFIKWGIELGVDNVFFTKILNWGTYSEEEFESISMMEKDNQSPKQELKEVLDKPIFKNPIVDLGTIQYDRNRVLPSYVDNYYTWETMDWMEKNSKKI